MPNFDNISNLFPQLKGAYIVGGAVRDVLLGQSPPDYDIAAKNPYQLAKTLSQKINASLVRLGKGQDSIFRIVSDKYSFDITYLNDNCIQTDLMKRDFSVNALAYEVSSREIIDVAGGIHDLKAKKLRIVSSDVFQKDPIRLIRAFRISSMLNFTIHPHTLSTIALHATLIRNAAKERIHAELLKFFQTSGSYTYLEKMEATKLIFNIFPELLSLKKCEQNQHHQYDVLQHTLKAYYHLEQILNTRFSEQLPQPGQNINKNRQSLLKCAILLHDIGKPLVKTFHKTVHFYDHESKGADMAVQICKRLKFSNNQNDFIHAIIRNHLRPMNLFLSSPNGNFTHKNLIRFFLKCKNLTPYLVLHSVADSMAKRSDNKNNSEFIDFAKRVLKIFYNDFVPTQTKPAFITGKDLIREFKLTPSPLFKTILDDLQQATLCKVIKTRQQALQRVQFFLEKHPENFKD